MPCWLVKAEPDSRIVKGKDVAFSVDDFEKAKTSPWDGVRNHQAKNLMRDSMKINDKVLFYHSNTKSPGIAATAIICKEGYPDYTAWDETHPYYDPKSNKDSPTWFMVDVEFDQRLENFVPLKLLQAIANNSLETKLDYLQEKHVDAIKEMVLLKRGRLSVQPVEDDAYETIKLLGKNGGWDSVNLDKSVSKAKGKTKTKTIAKASTDTNKVAGVKRKRK